MSSVARTWTSALSQHEQASASMVSGVGQTLVAFADTFEQRSASLLNEVNHANFTMQADQALADRQRLGFRQISNTI